jgi:hypothetical protein
MKQETMIMFVSICIIKDKADFAILFSQNRLLLRRVRPCLVLSLPLRTFKVVLPSFIKLKIILSAFKTLQHER